VKDSAKPREQLLKENDLLKTKVEDLEKTRIEYERTNKALQESEEKFRIVAETIPGVIYRCDLEWTFLFVGSEMKKLSGYPASDFINNKVRSYISIMDLNDEEMKHISDTLDEALRNKDLLYSSEYKIMTRDGSTKWVYDSVRIIYDENDAVIAYEGVLLDITKRKSAEEEVLKNKILLESSIESPKDMIILSLDREYRYLLFNNAHANSMRYAYDTEPRIGACIFDFMTRKDDINNVKAHYDKAMIGNGHTVIDEYGDGESRFYYEVKYNPIHNKKDEIIGVTAFAQNITDRKLVEQELSRHRDNLEEMVKERTKELEKTVKDLDSALKVFVGRELTISRLKKKIRDLKEKE